MSTFEHRVCPATGLRIHRSAENLIKANAVTAIVFLAVGGLFGLMVALTRCPRYICSRPICSILC